MAAPLCGPSNALQQFQKQTSTDRTLQQDRLQSRPNGGLAGDNFRSRTGPGVGSLDGEFEAFQRGGFGAGEGMGLGQFGGGGMMGSLSGVGSSQMGANMGQQHAGGWADDFQRLNIAGNGHAGSTQVGGWHQEFLRQGQRDQMPMQHGDLGYNVPLERLSSIVPRPGGFQSGMMMGGAAAGGMFVGAEYSGFNGMHGDQYAAQASHMVQSENEVFDEAAFTRAFDEAARAEFENAQGETQRDSGILLDDSVEGLLAREQPESATTISMDQQQSQPLPRIGADLIHDPQGDKDQHAHEDGDALARTAGELLDKVSGDQSEKFKNSSFLELMRQLRDKEVVVGAGGDGFVDADVRSGEREGEGEVQIAF